MVSSRIPIVVVLLLAMPATAVGQATGLEQPQPRRDVVVTGHRLADTETALKACLERHCPPDQDIDASLGHAENLFVAGRYGEARRVVKAAIGRNKHQAAAYPVPVSDLWRAESRLSVNLGDADAYRIATIESLKALKSGLSPDDPRVLEQQLDVADAFAHLGRVTAALEGYDAVERRARALRQVRTVSYVQLKRATLYVALSDHHDEYIPAARHAIGELAKGDDPQLATFRQAATILSLELGAKAGDRGAADRTIAASHLDATDRPVLIHAPPIEETSNDRAFGDGDVNYKMPIDDYDDQWADVSFRVLPDGTVSSPDLLRGSPKLDQRWLQPVFTAIRGRRYAPLKLAADDPGLLRVERYTRTAHLHMLTGSHVRTHEAYPRIEMVDLSAGDPPS